MPETQVQEKPKILLVEDSKDQAFVVTYFLKQNDFNVDWCNSPRSALQTALRENYELILLDVNLNASKDGFDLCQEFKSNPLTQEIPIIMLTARSKSQDRVNGLRLGADDYLTKPFNRDELLARIDTTLRRKKKLEFNDRYKELLENTDDIVLFLDEYGTIEHFNKKSENYFLTDQIKKNNVFLPELFESNFATTIENMLKRVREGNEVTGTSWKLKENFNNLKTVDVKLVPLHQGERIIGIGCILRDSTQREKAFEIYEKKTLELKKEVEYKSARLDEVQEKLIMSEKLAVMGELAAGVAHELRNPLNTISTSIYFLQKVLKSQNAKVDDHLKIILDEIQRAQGVISNLLDFARKSTNDRTEIDIIPILDQTLTLVKKELFVNDIVLKKEFNPVKKCLVNPDDMKQIFLNLILNAKDAMPDGGTLQVRTTMDSEGFIQLEFSDTGYGIPNYLINKIFDPFFTTKKTGQGVGIGLAIVHSAVKRNKGTIHVYSDEGKGATFVLHLPPSEMEEPETINF